MQMSFAVWQMAALLDYYEDRNRRGRASVWVLVSWGVCASNMLGVVQTTLTGLVIFALYVSRRQRPSRHEWAVFAAGCAIFGLLGGYYLHTLLAGAGGARLWTLSPVNLGFAIYELTGINGLGPSHLMLRNAALVGAEGVVALLRPYLAQIFLFCMVLGGLVLLGVFRLRQNRGMRDRVVLLGVMLAGGLVGLYLLATLVRWPFWGRHLASFFPTYILLLNCILMPIWQRRQGKGLLIIALLFSAYSALNLRFSSRFAREDYREAASIANRMAVDGNTVWWVAYQTAGTFYGLDFSTNSNIRVIKDINLDSAPEAPYAVFLNRPEAFDLDGKVRNLLRRQRYKRVHQAIPGFTVWLQTVSNTDA